jgi:hypothetical protein
MTKPQNDNTSLAFPVESKTLEKTISQVKYVIDQISLNFATARELILELAKIHAIFCDKQSHWM